MRLRKLFNEDGVGKIVKGVNTTQDVQPGETQRQAAKFGNTVDKDGRPPELHSSARKNSSPNTLFNMGLAESDLDEAPTTAAQSAAFKVLNNLAARKDNLPFPVKFYDGSIIKVKPSVAKRIINLYYKLDAKKQNDMEDMLNTKNGFAELATEKVRLESMFGEAQAVEPDSNNYQTDLITSPANTIIINTPGDLDWYKIGQHFPTLAQQDPHEFGQDDSDMQITLANAEELAKLKAILDAAGVTWKDIGGTDKQPEIHEKRDPMHTINKFLDDKKKREERAADLYKQSKEADNEKVKEDIGSLPPLVDLIILAVLAQTTVSAIKMAFKTGKGLMKLKQLAAGAGIRLSNRVMGEGRDPAALALKAAIDALHRLSASKGNKMSLSGYAFDISRAFNIGMGPKELEAKYHEVYG